MPSMIASILLIPLWIIAAIAWFAAAFSMLKVAGHARRLPDAPRFIRWNPFNILVRPDLWTPEARVDCQRVLVSFGVFVGSILISFLIALIAGLPIRG